MDNKKISVDDLFRQRLADREAPIPPGAWSRMEGLLDAKMPLGVAPVATPRRRGWAFLLAGLLLAGGGTFLYQSMPENQPVAETTPVEGVPSENQPLVQPAESPLENATPSGSISEAIASSSQPIPANPVLNSGKKTSGTAAVRSEKLSQSASETQISSAPVATSTTIPAAKIPESTAFTGTSAIAVPTRMAEVAPALPTHVLVREEVTPLQWVASRGLDLFSGKTIHPAQVARVQHHLLQWASGENNPSAPASSNWSAKIPAQSAPNPVVAPVHGKMLSAANTEGTALPPDAALKPVASLESKTPLAPVPTLDQKVDAAVEDLQNARFAFGLLAGINSTLGAGTGALQGLHAGIAGLLRLSEKWQLGAELRYAYRLNNSMDLKDDYFSGKTLNEATVMRNGRPFNAVRYEIDSMLSRYSFTAYSSLELPLQLRYEHKRMAFYGGPTLAFHFAPNVTRTDTRIATISRYDTLDAALPLPTLPGRTSNVSLSDFDSRFSLGYNVGAQYRLTPALRLDFRLSQQVWDHGQSRSAGSRRVSDTYLHIPSLQLSVGYFFGGNPASATQKKK